MTKQDLAQLASAYDEAIPNEMWREEGGGYDQQVAAQAYEAGALKMLELVQLHMASVVTEDFNKTASVFQLDGLIASNFNHFLKPFTNLLP